MIFYTYSRALLCALVLTLYSSLSFAQGEKLKITIEASSFELGELNLFEKNLQEAIHRLSNEGLAIEGFSCPLSIQNSISTTSNFATNIITNNNNMHRFNNTNDINQALNDNSNGSLKPLLCSVGVSSGGAISVLVTIPTFLKVEYQGGGAQVEIDSEALDIFGDYQARRIETMATSQVNSANRLSLSANSTEYMLLAVTHKWSLSDFIALKGSPIISSRDIKIKYLKFASP